MNFHLLLIDNDEDEMEIFNQAAIDTGLNCRCSYASSALTALEILPHLGVDFVFIDINMPVINGYECLSMIRKNIPWLKASLVMYSTGLDSKAEAKALSLGADLCMKKTLTIQDLTRNLSWLLGQTKKAG